MKLIAIILAGGYSSRMGSFKPLLDLGGQPAIARLCSAFSRAGLPTGVVSGHNAAALRPVIEAAGAVEIYNPNYSEGMFTSVKAGVRHALNIGTDGLLLAPADCSLISSEAAERVIAAAEAVPERFAVAAFAGKKGHPLYIPKNYFAEILSHTGSNGLKDITGRHAAEIARIETLDEGVLMDMDTPEAYRHMQEYLAGSLPRLAELMKGRRFILVRHGSTVAHAEKMFIGRYDLPLSWQGQHEARTAAEDIVRLRPQAERIYCSNLTRACESAAPVAAALGLEISVDPRLAELSLGEWDGLAISEVKRRFPAEYEARGHDILGYTPPGGENFYQLQYRAALCLKDILRADSSADIVICAHKGIIQAILGLLECRSPDFSAHSPAKGTVTVKKCVLNL